MFALDDVLLGHDDVGGDLIAYDPTGQGNWTVVAPSAVGRIEGVVFDSVAGAAMPGARVLIDGFDDFAVTDSAGTYALEGVPPGRYRLRLAHPRLDSLQVELPSVAVDVRLGATGFGDLAIPSRGTLAAARCPDPRTGGTFTLVGQVRDDLTGVPLGGATVVAAPVPEPKAAVRARMLTDGWYVACGLTTSTSWTLRAEGLGRASAPIEVSPSQEPILRADLVLGLADPLTLQGTVVAYGSGRPLPDVEVVMSDARSAITDAQGRFSFTAVRPGTVYLEARHLAYGIHGDSILLQGSETVHVRLELAEEAIQLAPVTVTVERTSFLGRPEARGTRLDLVTRAQVDSILNRGGVRDFGQLLAAALITGLRVTQRWVNYGGPGHPYGGYVLCIESNRRRRSPDCNPVVVYLNNIKISDPEWMLEDLLDPNAVSDIEFIPALEAGARFGTGSGEGVLLIYTRR
ncbi:MAG: carboxypeptidase regulatory-like domain-containing protein [Gemmatimonadota bacterium]